MKKINGDEKMTKLDAFLTGMACSLVLIGLAIIYCGGI